MSFASTLAISSTVCTAWLAMRMGAFGKNRVVLHDTPLIEHDVLIQRSLIFDRLSIFNRDRVGHFILREHGEVVPGYWLPDVMDELYLRPVKCTVIPYARLDELNAIMKESCTVVTKATVAELYEKVSKI